MRGFFFIMLSTMPMFAWCWFCDIETVNGIEWYYVFAEENATEALIGSGSSVGNPAVSANIVKGDITIPEKLGGLTVTEINDNAFRNCSGITSVTMPNGVRRVGSDAFFGCKALTNVVMSSSLTSIGDRAFKGCSSLPKINIPDSITKIGWLAFEGCTGLGSGVVVGGRCVLTVNGNCPSAVTISKDIRFIVDGAFLNCSSLMCFVVDAENPYYESVNNLLLTKNGKSLVCGVNGDVSIPNGVESIEERAFYGYDELYRVHIPSTVTNIASSAFMDCCRVSAFTVDSDNPRYKSANNLLLTKDGTTIVKGISGDVIIPKGVKEIGFGMFAGFVELTSIVIPEGVTRIHHSAFSCCSNLTSITIPVSATYIDKFAFYKCSGLTDVTVPGWRCNMDLTSVTNIVISDGTEAIIEDAFSGSVNLATVTIPSSTTNVGRNAFNDCSKLVKVDCCGLPPMGMNEAGINLNALIRYDVTYADAWLPFIDECGFVNTQTFQEAVEDGGPYYEKVDGINWRFGIAAKLGILGYGGTLAIDKTATGEIIVPTALGHALVATIRDGAFKGCSEITSLTIPITVTSITMSAFCGCGKLTYIDVSPDNPKYASVNGLLYDKAKSTLLFVPNGVTEVMIPETTEVIADGAFACASKLRSVTFAGKPPSKLDNVFAGTSSDLIVHADAAKAGWIQWGGRPVAFDVVSNSGASRLNINLTVTNVIVHYIQTSELSPMAAPVSSDVGVVNVMTEIKGGNVAIPESWAANYPTFSDQFGSDFSAALTKATGKKDAGGNPMLVWQDYVAGTDPTDENDVFKASVTMVDGVPVISYTPQLSPEENEKRVYTTMGKVKLQDANWATVSSGREADYNFFKVSVEMK